MKVKNIMFSGFAAAILMGVAAEANAAAKVVASKGYVDSIAGSLDALSTEAKDNLVIAINELNTKKQAKFDDGEGGSTTTGFISSVTQTGGAVTASATEFDTEITDQTKNNQNTAPTTKAVADAITASVKTYTSGDDINVGTDNSINATYASLDYESTADTVENANKLADGYAVSYVSQVDGKVKIGAKPYADRITEGEVMAPTTAAVYTAIQGVSGQTTNLNLDQVGGDGKYVKYVKQANGQVAAEEGTIDSGLDLTSLNPVTNAAITTALAEKQNMLRLGNNLSFGEDGKLNATDTTYEGEGYITVADGKIKTILQAGENITIGNDGTINTNFPTMPEACSAEGVTCVLTSENGAFAWAILAQPYSYQSGTETNVQRITDLGYAAQDQKIPEQLYTTQQ